MSRTGLGIGTVSHGLSEFRELGILDFIEAPELRTGRRFVPDWASARRLAEGGSGMARSLDPADRHPDLFARVPMHIYPRKDIRPGLANWCWGAVMFFRGMSAASSAPVRGRNWPRSPGSRSARVCGGP